MNVVFLGATKGMGRALARLMSQRGDSLVLFGRDPDDLLRSAEDLRIRGAQKLGRRERRSTTSGKKASEIHTVVCDLERPDGFSGAFDQAELLMGPVDTVVVTAGMFADQAELEADPALTARLLTVNFSNTVLFCEEARRRLVRGNGGTLCVFSSVAGDRGRKPVVLYGATKAGLSYYLEGLDVRYRDQGLRTICVKPGFVKTAMTSHLKPPPFAGEPDQVAKHVLRAIDRGQPTLYTPHAWGAIMRVIRALPRSVMRRVSF